MMISVRNSLNQKWQHLSGRSGAKSLSPFALILLFALDVFILVAMMDGLKNVSRVVEMPWLPISNRCIEMSYNFVRLKATDRVDLISPYIQLNPSARGEGLAEFPEDETALKTCQNVRNLLLLTVANKGLIALYSQRENQSREIKIIESKISDLKSSYEAALLERVANQSREDSILPASATQIKGEIARFNSDLSALQTQKADTQAALESNPVLLLYEAKVNDLLASGEFDQALRTYQHEVFVYPFKVMLVQVVFLLPLLVLAIYWNVRAIRRQDDSKILISSHFVIVCLLPIFLRVLQFVYELLPEYLIDSIVGRLARLNLIFLVNYGVVLGGIGGGLLVIFIAQRTYFRPARLRMIRLRKMQCNACGEKLSSSHQAWCEVCGAGQLETCRSCGRSHRILASHCHSCGSTQN